MDKESFIKGIFVGIIAGVVISLISTISVAKVCAAGAACCVVAVGVGGDGE